LIPSDPKDLALVRQWSYIADSEIWIGHNIANYCPYAKPTFTAIVDTIVKRLTVIEEHLSDKTFLVGERVTIADVLVASAIHNAFCHLIDAPVRAKLPNVVRYVET
jgi:elongation factor 1-gamma